MKIALHYAMESRLLSITLLSWLSFAGGCAQYDPLEEGYAAAVNTISNTYLDPTQCPAQPILLRNLNQTPSEYATTEGFEAYSAAAHSFMDWFVLVQRLEEGMSPTNLLEEGEGDGFAVWLLENSGWEFSNKHDHTTYVKTHETITSLKPELAWCALAIMEEVADTARLILKRLEKRAGKTTSITANFKKLEDELDKKSGQEPGSKTFRKFFKIFSERALGTLDAVVLGAFKSEWSKHTPPRSFARSVWRYEIIYNYRHQGTRWGREALLLRAPDLIAKLNRTKQGATLNFMSNYQFETSPKHRMLALSFELTTKRNYEEKLETSDWMTLAILQNHTINLQKALVRVDKNSRPPRKQTNFEPEKKAGWLEGLTLLNQYLAGEISRKKGGPSTDVHVLGAPN